MKLYAPEYYPTFRCIADKCRHSCCIGWEIDIDEDTLEYYRSTGGGMGERLARGIEQDDGGAHFILQGEEERCPFLNESGLCDIYDELGEDALCQICTDHPRFRNYFDSRTEIGLGLCCEEACRIILTWQERPEMISIEDDGLPSDDVPQDDSGADEAFFALRSRAVDMMFDNGKPLGERCGSMLAMFAAHMPVLSPADIRRLFGGLEYMENELPRRLEQLTDTNTICVDDIFRGREEIAARLISYFLFRHLADGREDGTLAQRAVFAVVSAEVIGLLSGDSMSDILDTARMFSSEIEYSDENVDALLEAFTE